MSILLNISFVHWLVVLSALISLVASAAYIKNTILGKTKPNRVTMFMWAFAPLIGTAAALSAHADPWATFRIFLAGFIPLLILVVDSPSIAVLLSAIGDGFAALPTIRKAWNHPETETGLMYVGGLIGVLIILPSIPKWDIVNSSFQIYLVLANIALIFSVYRKPFWKKTSSGPAV